MAATTCQCQPLAAAQWRDELPRRGMLRPGVPCAAGAAPPPPSHCPPLEVGRVVKEGPARALADDPDLQKAYLGG